MSRHDAIVSRIEARVAHRKAARKRAAARRNRARKTRHDRAVRAPVKRRRSVARRLAAVRALPAPVREAYDAASPAVRRLILEQARDARTPFVRTGPSLDDALAWKSA